MNIAPSHIPAPVCGVWDSLRAFRGILGDPLHTFEGLFATHGDLLALDLGGRRVVLAFGPDHVEHVLQDHGDNYPKSRAQRSFATIFRDGLLVSENPIWGAQRKIVGKGFRTCALDELLQVAGEAADATVVRWSRLATSGTSLDLKTEMNHVTFDVICRAVFGRGITDIDPTLQICRDFGSIMGAVAHRAHRPWALPWWVPLPAHRTFNQALRRCRQFVRQQLAVIRAGQHPGGTFSRLLLAAFDEGAMSEELLEDEVMVLLVGAHDTMLNGMSRALWLLAHRSELQQTLADEAQTVGRCATLRATANLRWARAVFDETLRLFPPVWCLDRQAVENDQIGALAIPAGTIVLLSPYITHRHPQYWREPTEFRPERFLEANGGIRAGAYFPFSAGRRKCAGHKFAVLEAQLLLSELVQQFVIEPQAPQQRALDATATLTAIEPMPVRIRLRRSSSAHFPANVVSAA